MIPVILVEDESSSNVKKYYHFSNRVYNLGENIIKSYSIADDIKRSYDEATGKDVNHIIYCRDFVLYDCFEDYDYCYEIEVENPLEGDTDYSSYLLNLEIDILLKRNETFAEQDPKLRLTRQNLIDLFIKAYFGDDDSKKLLDKCCDYSPSYEKEFIVDSAKVVGFVEDL